MKSLRQASWLTLSLSLVITSLASIAFGGGEGGGHVGGGGGWVCREQNGDIRWVRILDLDEGRRQFVEEPSIIPYGTEDQFKKYTMDEWLTRAEQRIQVGNRDFYAQYLEAKKNVMNVLKHVENSDFVSTKDFDPRTKPAAADYCAGGVLSAQPEQLATFDDDLNILYVNDKFWKSAKMQEIDRAALIMHEVVYYMYRHQALHRNSIKSRRLVGLLFSNTPLAELKEVLSTSTLKPEGVWLPRTGKYRHIKTGKSDFFPLVVDSFSPQSGLLKLRQISAESGTTKQRHEFKCRKVITEASNLNHPELYKFVCKMTYASSWWTRHRGYDNHELQITDKNILWLNVQNSGVTWENNYVLEE